jgi:4-hydroxybutyrate dehydrogenase
MPAVLQLNADAIRDRFNLAAAYLGIEGGFDGFCAFVDDFNASFAIPRTLTELGVENPDFDALTEAALRDPSVGGNPVALTQENVRAMFDQIA